MLDYSSDTDGKVRKRPTIIQKIDYSLSSEEGPLKNATTKDNIYDNTPDFNSKFQVEEEKSMFTAQPTKR